MGTRAVISVLAGAGFLLFAPQAAAVPNCPSQPRAEVIATDQGRLESITSDAGGRLFYTDLTDNRLLRIDGPGQRPKVLSTGIARPGGLAFDSDGSLITGYSGGALSGAPGNGMAGIYRIDPETGAKQPFVSGLDQANGLVRGPDGSFYTSNNIAGEVVRVLPDGTAQRDWANVESANGLVIDSQERYLFAAQTFTPAKIARLELANPSAATTYFAAGPGDTAAGLDGLTRDGADRLFAAANGAGEVWRVGTDGQACALARNLMLPSALAFGGGGPGFNARNLYVVTFGGRVIELVDATDRPPAAPPGSPARPTPSLRLSVRPRRARPGARIRLRFTVTSEGARIAGASVRLGRRTATTGALGTATLRHRFRRAGRFRCRASRAGYNPDSATIVVRRARAD